ncbi:hypothetical protein N180_01085 [Pedobacter antarcticus 4BY]|uniref:TRASH domain-containing protein n=2 Tax=Pedobacter antarcticus TaxID=34086 RepID=A0A081PC35_9SPHI|nr:hypothetical protein [Pedobacter antarcticus]KEQ28258.1 hypothetical protein N180_01085 [Pedobacter antarcticus 4BY]SFE46890.1 YHS domain-containing protein [Pedobacter antarcticus]
MKRLIMICTITLLFSQLKQASANEINSAGKMNTMRSDTTKIKIAEKDLADKKDLVCGMHAFKFLKDTAVVDKKIYGFCSKSCKSRFIKNPKAYLKTI